MNSFSKTNMSSLMNSLNYTHAGHTYATTPFNLVKNVKLVRKNEFVFWRHFVYSLDKKHMKKNALSMNQFKKTVTGQSNFKAFSFFVKYVYELHEQINLVSGHFVSFLEWVKTKDVNEQMHCGIRLHIFVASVVPVKNDILQSIFMSNRTMKKSRKVIMNQMDHDLWQQITSKYEYATNIADVYTKTFEASSSIEEMGFESVEHKANFQYVFGLHSPGFCIPLACDLQNCSSNYIDASGNFIFPDESRIYRMIPTDLMPDKFFYKYLPDYFFLRIKMPDAIVSNETDDSDDGTPGTFDLTIKPRLERDRYSHYLCRTSVKRNGNTWTFSSDDKDDVFEKLSPSFLIYESNPDNPNIVADVEGIHSWVLCQPKTKHLIIHDENRNSNATPIVSPLISSLLVNKHSLSDLDILKFQGEFRLNYSTNRRAFQEEMVQAFCERIWDDVDADISDAGRNIIIWKQHKRDNNKMNFQFQKYDKNMSIFANRAIRIMDFFEKSLFVSSAHKTLFLLNHTKCDAYRQDTNLHFNQIYTGEGATSKSFLFEKMIEMSIEGTVDSLTYQTKRADAIDGDIIDTILVFNEAPPGLFMTNKNSDGEAEAMFKEKLTSQVVRCKEFYRDENTGERKNRIAKSQCIGVVMGATNDNPSDCQEAMATRFYWGQFEKGSLGRSIQECMRGERDMKSDENAMLSKEIGIAYAKEEQMRVWLVYKFIYMKILHKPTLKAADIVYDRLSNRLKRVYKANIPPRTKERYEILCNIFVIVNALDMVFNIKGGKHAGTTNNPNVFHPIQLLDIEPYLYCTEEIAIFAFSHIQEEFVNPNEYKLLQSLFTIHKGNKEYMEERDGSTDNKVLNYSYCHMNRFKRLMIEIANNIPVTSGRMSQHNIEALMNNLKDRTICGRTYTIDMHNESLKTYRDGLPEPTQDPPKKQFAVIVSMEGTFVHMDLFDNVRRGLYVNKVKESIKCLNHKYAYRYRNHMIGTNIRDTRSIIKYPNLFDTIELSRGESVIKMSNPLYVNRLARINDRQDESELSEKQKYRTLIIKNDLTIAGAMTHAEVLKMSPHAFCLKYTEKMIDFDEASHTYCYPRDYIQMYKDMKEQTDDHHEEFSNTFDYEPINKRQRIL